MSGTNPQLNPQIDDSNGCLNDGVAHSIRAFDIGVPRDVSRLSFKTNPATDMTEVKKSYPPLLEDYTFNVYSNFKPKLKGIA